jgi:uncharacterized protein YecT (DUF1311 family)
MLLILLAAATSCTNPQTQAQMTQCAGQAYAAADAAMTRQWKATYAQMKGLDARDTSRGGGFGYAGALLESQRAWLKYRDTQCIISAGEFAGGSMQPMANAQCKRGLTDLRTRELKALIWRT